MLPAGMTPQPPPFRGRGRGYGGGAQGYGRGRSQKAGIPTYPVGNRKNQVRFFTPLSVNLV